MAEQVPHLWSDEDELLAVSALEDLVLVPGPLVQQTLTPAPLGGMPGAPGAPGAGTVVAVVDGAEVVFPVLPPLAIAADAVEPDLGTAHALAWSTLLDAPVVWTGALWRELGAGGGTTPPDPLQLVNEQGETLINDQGESIDAG